MHEAPPPAPPQMDRRQLAALPLAQLVALADGAEAELAAYFGECRGQVVAASARAGLPRWLLVERVLLARSARLATSRAR